MSQGGEKIIVVELEEKMIEGKEKIAEGTSKNIKFFSYTKTHAHTNTCIHTNKQTNIFKYKHRQALM